MKTISHCHRLFSSNCTKADVCLLEGTNHYLHTLATQRFFSLNLIHHRQFFDLGLSSFIAAIFFLFRLGEATRYAALM